MGEGLSHVGQLFILNGVSLDGYFEGPDHDISWHRVDDDHRATALSLLADVDAIVVGRRTYELFAGFWPTEAARKADPEVARVMNGTRKVVVSRTMEAASWENSTVVRSVADIAALKERSRRLALLGSGSLGAALVAADLVDGIQLIVMPVLLGRGTPHLAGAPARDLELVEETRQRGGNVLMHYRVLAPTSDRA